MSPICSSARAAGRQTEFAIRAAIGISRARLVRQMLTESLLLAVTGGVIGCVIGAALLRIIVWADPNGIPHLADASLDGRVLALSLALSLLAGLLFGLAPAFQRPRAEALGSSRSIAPRSATIFKNTLVAAQIAFSTVLLAASGLLVRSLWNLETQPLGMETNRVLTAQLVLPSSRYTKPEERIAFFNQVEQQLGAIPGIRALGLSDSLPPAGWERSRLSHAWMSSAVRSMRCRHRRSGRLALRLARLLRRSPNSHTRRSRHSRRRTAVPV